MSSWLRVQSGCVIAGCRCLSVYLPVKGSRLPLTLRHKKTNNTCSLLKIILLLNYSCDVCLTTDICDVESVSARNIGFPSKYTISTSYRWNGSIMPLNRFGALPRGFFIMFSGGLWSDSTMIPRSKVHW